jgi:histone H3/H4
MTELIVKSNVRDAFDDHQVSADLFDALDEEVESLLEEAARRASENDRRTVRPADL